MKKSVIFGFSLFVSVILIILSVLLLTKNTYIIIFISFLIINVIFLFLVNKNNIRTKEAKSQDLREKLTAILDELNKSPINPDLLKETYYKSIKLFEFLITNKETTTIIEEHFKSLLQNEINRSIRYKKSLTLLLVKIFNAQKYNENLNSLLRRVVNVCKGFLRDIDVLSKFKNEYLILMLPETGIKGANTVGARILSQSKRLLDKSGTPMNLILSLGISVFPFNGKTVDELMSNAEKNIENADRLGGNHIIFNVE